MHRRTALRALAAGLLPVGLLQACGGGGGGLEGAADAGARALASLQPLALWGDSHVGGLPGNPEVPGVASKLSEIAGGRQVMDGGVAGQTSTQIADRMVQDSAHDAWVTVFWYGGNNQNQPEAIKADLARSVASLAPGNERFVVLPVLNQAAPWERRGTPTYQTIIELNQELAALYPDNFLDIRSHLVGLYNRNSPADVADFQDDVVPTSLRADGVHLNHEGALAVARRLLEFIVSRGW